MKANGLVRIAAALVVVICAGRMDAAELVADPLAAAGHLDGAFQPCEACDCCCDRVSHWFAGVEATFLSIEAATGGRATMTINDSDTPGLDVSLIGAQGLDDNFGAAPRVWVGRKFGDKWGVVGRFWYLSQSEIAAPDSPAGFVNQANFLTLVNNSRAEMYTVDVEAVRSFVPGAWKIDGTLGGRYGSLDTRSDMDASGVFTTGNFLNLALGNGSQFTGAGLTGSLSGRRQLGDSPWSLFISGRASQLWGRTDSFARAAGTLVVPPNSPLAGAATVRRSNAQGTATIGEIQVGAQWDMPLQRWPVQVFFRAAVEYQRWVIDGLPTGGAGFGGTLDDITVNSFSRANLPDAELIGVSFTTGFAW